MAGPDCRMSCLRRSPGYRTDCYNLSLKQTDREKMPMADDLEQAVESEAAPGREPSGLGRVTFLEIYAFLWKFTAATLVFLVPFCLIYLWFSAYHS